MDGYKYGLLKSSASNLGDDVQSVVVKSMLPTVDCYLDYDFLGQVKSDQKIKMIIHGCCRPKEWPPSPLIEPLIVSFSIADTAIKRLTSDESIRYLKEHEPIGCRDYFTLNTLRDKGVSAYFSGCITFALSRWNGERTNEILAVDLDKDIVERLPGNTVAIHHGGKYSIDGMANWLYNRSPILHKLVKKTRLHMALGDMRQAVTRLREDEDSVEGRLLGAEVVLGRYRKAKLVITSRLHCALPCVAFGTPVIFVHRNLGDIRFSGLLKYVRAYRADMFKRKIGHIDFDNPLPNPKAIHKPVNELRNNLIARCAEFLKEG